MPCYYPLKGYVSPSGGITFNRFNSRLSMGQTMDVPCGSCIGCLKERARQWAVRLYHEAQMYTEAGLGSTFINLTYNDQNLPWGTPFVDAVDVQEEDGLKTDMPSLRLGHITHFMRTLRQNIIREYGSYEDGTEIRLRFYIAGEYGPKTQRPHYHGVVFGWSFPDRLPIGVKGKSGKQLYRSAMLERSWAAEGQSRGYSSLGESLTPESLAYVTKYITKIQDFGARDPFKGMREVERAQMSRNPGLGRSWIGKYWRDVYPADEVIINGRPQKPPRFYDRYMEDHHPFVMEPVKRARKERAIERGEEFACELDSNPFRATQKEEHEKLTAQPRDAF